MFETATEVGCCVTETDSLQEAPAWAVHSAWKRKLIFQWRSQDIEDARNIGCLPAKASGTE